MLLRRYSAPVLVASAPHSERAPLLGLPPPPPCAQSWTHVTTLLTLSTYLPATDIEVLLKDISVAPCPRPVGPQWTGPPVTRQRRDRGTVPRQDANRLRLKCKEAFDAVSRLRPSIQLEPTPMCCRIDGT